MSATPGSASEPSFNPSCGGGDDPPAVGADGEPAVGHAAVHPGRGPRRRVDPHQLARLGRPPPGCGRTARRRSGSVPPSTRFSNRNRSPQAGASDHPRTRVRVPVNTVATVGRKEHVPDRVGAFPLVAGHRLGMRRGRVQVPARDAARPQPDDQPPAVGAPPDESARRRSCSPASATSATACRSAAAPVRPVARSMIATRPRSGVDQSTTARDLPSGEKAAWLRLEVEVDPPHLAEARGRQRGGDLGADRRADWSSAVGSAASAARASRL